MAAAVELPTRLWEGREGHISGSARGAERARGGVPLARVDEQAAGLDRCGERGGSGGGGWLEEQRQHAPAEYRLAVRCRHPLTVALTRVPLALLRREPAVQRSAGCMKYDAAGWLPRLLSGQTQPSAPCTRQRARAEASRRSFRPAVRVGMATRLSHGVAAFVGAGRSPLQSRGEVAVSTCRATRQPSCRQRPVAPPTSELRPRCARPSRRR